MSSTLNNFIKDPSKRIWGIFKFTHEWTINFSWRCKIIWIREVDPENYNHIYAAELIELFSGDKKLWTGWILESELSVVN